MRYITTLIFILLIATLDAQSRGGEEKWIGFSNLFFKNMDKNDFTPHQTNTSIIIENGLLDHQFSVGFYFRKINKKRIYQQFDLFEIGWNRNKDHVTAHVTAQGLTYTETTRGSDRKDFNVLLGYQRGKLFPILPRLNGDIGVRGFAWYKRVDTIPLNVIAYPRRTKSLGLGLNLAVGLNYQVHKRINIGYSFVPISTMVFWNEDYVNNPILPEHQRIERGIEFDSNFFKSVLGLRNFNISYVF